MGYSKTCVKQPLSKRPQIGFQDQLSLNAGQRYCRMLQGEHSATLSTFIKLPFVIKIFVLSILSGRITQFYRILYADSLSDKSNPNSKYLGRVDRMSLSSTVLYIRGNTYHMSSQTLLF